MTENPSSIVFDFGACYSKIGEASEEVPRAILPSMYCATDEDFLMCASDTHKLEHYFGYDAFRREGVLPQREFFDIQRDVERPDIVGRFLHQSMYDNFSNSETGYQGVLLLDKPSSSTKTKARLAEVFLEWNKFQRFSAIPDYAATLYATGKTTGVVVSCGYSMTYAAAVFDGVPSPFTIAESSYCARHVESQVRDTLKEIGYSLKGKTGAKACEPSRINTRAFLENSCLVSSPDNQKELQKVRLPDGLQFEVPHKEITAPFEPYFDDKDPSISSIPKLIQKAVSQVSPYFRDQLYSNIVLEGGITKVPHFYERLLSELGKDGSQKPKLNNTCDRLLMPSIGANKLKDWIDDNKLWFDLRALNEKGIERAMADIARSF
jgi:actin-related protein